MRYALALAIVLLAAPLVADDAEWRTIPLIDDGQVAPAWQHAGFGAVKVEYDALVTAPDERGLGLLVYTKEKLGDCQIRIVYRPENAKSNAGAFVRIDDGILDWIGKEAIAVRRDENGKLPPNELLKMFEASESDNGAWYAVHHGYEVQMCDTGDAMHRTGAIYSLALAAVPPKRKPDEWRTMVITLDGNIVRVEQDGKQLTTFDPAATDLPERKEWYEPKRDNKRPQTGYFGLQTHDPGDIVYFKEVSVRPLAK